MTPRKDPHHGLKRKTKHSFLFSAQIELAPTHVEVIRVEAAAHDVIVGTSNERKTAPGDEKDGYPRERCDDTPGHGSIPV